MDNQLIPLFKISPNKEYLINSVDHTKNKTIDLSGYGLVPGAKIKLLFASPSKDPLAYEIMGTVLALRNTDAENIYVLSANS